MVSKVFENYGYYLAMHELSLCQSIIRQVEHTFTQQEINKNTPAKVRVTLGALAGVDSHSLLFWFPVVAKEMHYEKLNLEIIHQPAYGACCLCHKQYIMQTLLDYCPECGSFERDILSGMEFTIKSLEI